MKANKIQQSIHSQHGSVFIDNILFVFPLPSMIQLLSGGKGGGITFSQHQIGKQARIFLAQLIKFHTGRKSAFGIVVPYIIKLVYTIECTTQ